jgi:hypothetical protein
MLHSVHPDRGSRGEERPMPRYYELEVSLREAKPRIWRRFWIAEKASFLDLHEAIQDASGWSNCHLFSFRDPEDEPLAGLPDDEYGAPDPDAKKVKLRGYFEAGEGARCTYLYDFGDGWEHDVKLLRAVELPEKFGRRLLGGARAFPPEDCGGIPGYEDCVRVAKGGKDPDGLREWMGDWNPERFDFKEMARHFDRPKLSLRGHYEETF